MTNITTEVVLSVAIIVLTVFAIAVFIISGSGALFYGLFVITALLMFYMWYKLSRVPPELVEQVGGAGNEPAAPVKRRKARARTKRRKK